jgi:hypothetical protein
MTDPNETLSISGEKRREEILNLARGAARQRRRNRRALQATGGVALGLLAAIYLFHALSPSPGNPRELRGEDPSRLVARNSAEHISPRPPPQESRVVITTILTQPGITAQLAFPPRQPHWERIGDDQLLQSLAEAGHQAGLISVNGQTVLLSR